MVPAGAEQGQSARVGALPAGHHPSVPPLPRGPLSPVFHVPYRSFLLFWAFPFHRRQGASWAWV